jgi:hypothetical protein
MTAGAISDIDFELRGYPISSYKRFWANEAKNAWKRGKTRKTHGKRREIARQKTLRAVNFDRFH